MWCETPDRVFIRMVMLQSKCISVHTYGFPYVVEQHCFKWTEVPSVACLRESGDVDDLVEQYGGCAHVVMTHVCEMDCGVAWQRTCIYIYIYIYTYIYNHIK